MSDNVTINVQQDNDIVNIISSEVTEVIDVNVYETTEEVTLNITEEVIQVNINKVTGGGSSQSLAETLDIGNNTGGTDILLNNDDAIQLENNSSIRKGTYDFGQNGGVSRICGVDFEDMWQGGIRHVFDNNGYIRNSTNCFNVVPNNTFDITLRFKVGSIWTLDDGTNYICTDATTDNAVWELYNVIPTNTSDLNNDSDFVSDASYVHTDNNFTTTLKTKLDGIAEGAEVNVNADWNATSGDAEILNKPSIPAAQIQSDWTQTNNVALDYIKNKPSLTGYGDMFKSTYDTDDTGIVDNAEAIKIIGRNSTGATLRRGTIIYISGSTGNRPNFVKAKADSEATSAGTFGVIADDLANNTDGYALALGYLDNLDTRSNATYPFTTDTLADGDTIYLSPSTAGYITNVKPSAPNHLVYLGKVTRTHPSLGTIVYRVQNGYELEELHNVAISSVADKQLLSYESATSLWKNKSVTTADIADSADKRYCTDAQKTIIGNTSGTNTGDETQSTILSKLAYYNYKNTTSSSTLTGTLTETQLLRVTIPANTFSATDFLKFNADFVKTGVLGIATLKIKISTSATMPSGGGGQIASMQMGTTILYSPYSRRFTLKGGNVVGFPFTGNSISDIQSGATISSQAFDPTVINYFYVSVTLANILDSVYMNSIQITNI